MIDKQSYIKIKFGVFEFSGDVEHLDIVIEQVLRLRQEVDLIPEPEDIAKVYG